MDSSQIDSLRLNKVPLGLSLVYYGLQLWALALILMFVVPFVLAGNLALAVKVIFGLIFLLIGAGILSFVGKALCLTAPSEMQGRGAIYLAVILDALGVLIQVANYFTTMPEILAKSTNLLAITSFVCFLLFLQSLGRFLHNNDLTSKSTGLLKLGIAVVVILLLMLVSVFVFVDPLILMVLFLVVIGLGLLGLIRYSRLLLAFKKELKRT